MVKNLPANAGDIRDRGSMPGLRREGLEEGTATHSCVLFFFFPTPVFLPGEFHGQKNLAGYSPWGWKELDTTEAPEHVCMHLPKTLPPHREPKGHILRYSG